MRVQKIWKLSLSLRDLWDPDLGSHSLRPLAGQAQELHLPWNDVSYNESAQVTELTCTWRIDDSR